MTSSDLLSLFQLTYEKETFINVPHASAQKGLVSPQLHYHHALSNLETFVAYTQKSICDTGDSRCSKLATSLLSAHALEIDFDQNAQTLRIAALWERQSDEKPWFDHIRQLNGSAEVGVLHFEKSSRPEEHTLGGYLTFLGRDDHPSTSDIPCSLSKGLPVLTDPENRFASHTWPVIMLFLLQQPTLQTFSVRQACTRPFC